MEPLAASAARGGVRHLGGARLGAVGAHGTAHEAPVRRSEVRGGVWARRVAGGGGRRLARARGGGSGACSCGDQRERTQARGGVGEAVLPGPRGGCGACGGLAQAAVGAGRGQRCAAMSCGVAARAAVVCGRATEGGAAWEGASWPWRVVARWCRWPREDFRGLPGCGCAARDGILLAKVSPASCRKR